MKVYSLMLPALFVFLFRVDFAVSLGSLLFPYYDDEAESVLPVSLLISFAIRGADVYWGSHLRFSKGHRLCFFNGEFLREAKSVFVS